MSAFASLQGMRDSLKEGLALLDGAAHDDPHVVDALGELTAEIAAFGNPKELRESVAIEDHERFDDELEELIRLNAVLVAAVSQDREQLFGRLKQVRTSLRDLEYYGEQGSSGARCDISG